MKYTPGPWQRDGLTVYALDERRRNRFSTQLQHDFSGITREELEANAHLIAAAPELLEAVRKCRSALASTNHATYCNAEETDCGCACGLTAACVSADAAIAKATGEAG